MSLMAFRNALDLFRQLNGTMPMQQAAFFCEVLERPGITITEAGNRVGLSQAAATRNAQALGKWFKMGVPGLDLVEAVENPANRREKQLHLTKKGEIFARNLKSAVS